MSAPVTVSSFPLILAGPILRRVDPPRDEAPAAVTVWLALREPRRVTLTVSEGSTALLRGEADTRRLGEHFHAVAVTADSRLDGDLAPGTVYSYDLSFGDPSTGASETLEDALGGDLGVVTYGSQPKPTFSLPPPNPAQLRIVHASCRKPHGEGRDVLPAVDSMIRPTVSAANDRPHQLFLTGDQIYADDVADVLLAYIDQLGPALLGRTETFGSGADAKTLADMPPGTRQSVVKDECGFSTGASGSHLLGLAEYYAMYVLSWSDAAWPAQLATPAELRPDAHATAMKYVNELRPGSFDEVRGWVEESGTLAAISWELHDAGRYRDQAEFVRAVDVLEAFTETRDRVRSFAEDLPAVRRALANVPTYMMFDDHEITDDWYLNAEWCERVVDSKMGGQVLQNGLIAYAVCQGWGNAPDRFGTGTKGDQVLDAATIGGSGPDLNVARADLDGLLGIPTVSGGTLVWPPDPIDWHYPVRGTSDGTTTAHEVLVLDTRTRRGFETGDEKAPPEVLRADAFADQLPPTTATPEVTVVVSAVPVWTVPLVDLAQDYLGGDEAEADKEHWRYQHDARERLLARLATRTPEGGSESDDPRRSRIVLLSGDVHHGYTARVQFWGTRPFGSTTDDESEFVLASLTASAAKNEELKTRLLHSLGYEGAWIVSSGLGVLMLAGDLVWQVFGDSPPLGYRLAGVGLLSTHLVKLLEGTPEEVNFGWNEEPPDVKSPPDVVERDPLLVRILDDIDDVYELEPAPAPDWRYRVDYLDAETYHEDGVSHSVGDPADIVVPPHGASGPETRPEGLDAYEEHLGTWASMTYHAGAGPSDRGGEYGYGSEIVGGNNVGEVAFEWGTEKRAVHAVWWRGDGSSGPLPPFPLSKYVVSLEYDDDDHPRPEVVARS